MRYKTRRNLFILFTLLFFISIGPIVLYTQGYRPDTKNITLTKTGGLDLDVYTSNSEVYLNNKFQRETNFLFRNAVFRNILPGKYDIEIKKIGYNVWQKMAIVEKGQVTKFPTIRLFPLELQKGILMKNTENIFISPDAKFSIIQIASPVNVQGKNTSQLVFYDLDIRLSVPLLTLQAEETVRSVKWAPSGVFYILIDDSKGSLLYTGTGAQDEKLTDWNAFLLKSYPISYAKDTIITPTNSPNTLYIITLEADKTYSVNMLELEQGIIKPNIITDILGFNIVEDEIFYLDKLGALKSANLSNKTFYEITPTAILEPSATKTKIIVRNDKKAIVTINNGDLFLWQEGSPLEKIADEVLSASFSPDNNKLLYRDKDKVVIYWIKEVFGPPGHIIGDEEVLVFANLLTADWIGFESNHLVLQIDNEIIFTELDERDKRNTVSYELKNSKDIFKVDIFKQGLYTILNDSSFVFLKYE